MARLGKDVKQAVEILAKGGLVAIPTETVYGLAANALNERAVLKVFEVKQRPFFDPLILHSSSLDKVNEYAYFNDKRLQDLAHKFWPGPLTLLLPKKEIVPDIVTSGLPRVAVRVPNHPLTLELLTQLQFPLAAPSANPFGYVSPTEPEHVEKHLGKQIDYILDGGRCSIGIESTIIGIEGNDICLYRLGGLTLEEIEKVAGPVKFNVNHSDNPEVPGQLKSHYAPRKKLLVGKITELIEMNKEKKMALIYFGENLFEKNDFLLFNLSEKKDLNEAALNLFKFLRDADASEAEVVLFENVPDTGLGRAINDRMKRASA